MIALPGWMPCEHGWVLWEYAACLWLGPVWLGHLVLHIILWQCCEAAAHDSLGMTANGNVWCDAWCPSRQCANWLLHTIWQPGS